MEYMVGLNTCGEYRRVLEESLGQTRSTGSRANNCSLYSWIALAPLWMQNKYHHCLIPQKLFFFLIVGHFLYKHRRNPSIWQMSFNAQRRWTNKNLVVMKFSPHPVCFTVEVTVRHWPQNTLQMLQGVSLGLCRTKNCWLLSHLSKRRTAKTPTELSTQMWLSARAHGTHCHPACSRVHFVNSFIT